MAYHVYNYLVCAVNVSGHILRRLAHGVLHNKAGCLHVAAKCPHHDNLDHLLDVSGLDAIRERLEKAFLRGSTRTPTIVAH